jgi:hypothetical protein
LSYTPRRRATARGRERCRHPLQCGWQHGRSSRRLSNSCCALSNWLSRPSSRSTDMFAGRLIVAKSTLLDVRHDSSTGTDASRILMTTEMIGAGQSRPSFRRSFGKIISTVTRLPFKNSLGARALGMPTHCEPSRRTSTGQSISGPRPTPFSSASDGPAEVSQSRSQDRETKRRAGASFPLRVPRSGKTA